MYPEFNQPMMHQMQMAGRFGTPLPPMPEGYNSIPHENFRMNEQPFDRGVIDPLGGADPAAKVTGEDKKNSIKEYLDDLKARNKAARDQAIAMGQDPSQVQQEVPTFSNVTGSNIGQRVSEFGVPEGQQSPYAPSQVYNLDEYQQAPQGMGMRDPMGGRDLIPGENFGSTPDGQAMAAEKLEQRKLKKNSGNYEKQVEAHLDELAPVIAAELGFSLETGPQSPEQAQKFMAAMRDAGEDFTVAWYRELDRAMELLKSGKFSGVEEFIAGGMKDPSLIKREVAGQDFLIEMYKDGLTKYNDEELARDYAIRQQAMVKELIKNGKLDEALKGDTSDPAAGGGVDPAGGALPGGPAGAPEGALGPADANARSEMVRGPADPNLQTQPTPAGKMYGRAEASSPDAWQRTQTQPTPAGQMGATPQRLDEAKKFARQLMQQGVTPQQAKQQLLQRYPDLKDYI